LCYRCTIPSSLLLNAWTSENFVFDVQPLAYHKLEHLSLLLGCFLTEQSLFQSNLDQLDHLLLDYLMWLCLRQQIKISFFIQFFVLEIIVWTIFIDWWEN
jgi:hypothetical protein